MTGRTPRTTVAQRARHRPRRLWSIAVIAVVFAVSAGLAVATVGEDADATRPVRAEGAEPTLREVDGGQDYFARFQPSLSTGDDYFPLGVWYESVTDPADVRQDREAGLNLYVELTANSDLGLVGQSGMHAIHGHVPLAGRETVGWLLADEADMWAGPGSAEWSGNYPGQGVICVPDGVPCGYTVQETLKEGLPDDQRLRFANYGKGVVFWQSREEAAAFVNGYQDVVSADTYWYTDENICGPSEGGGLLADGSRIPDEKCHLAANYGATVDHVRGLVEPAGSRPVWAFVELGHPFSESDWPTITPAQVRAAVWSSLINGARGIVYFNHSFGGSCISQHVLREPCYADVRRGVTRLNQQISELAEVLNSPFAEGMTSTQGGVDVMTKYSGGKIYVMAAATSPGGGLATFSLRCFGDATVTVLDENRTLDMAGGRFRDDFADGEAVHLYVVDRPPGCDLE